MKPNLPDSLYNMLNFVYNIIFNYGSGTAIKSGFNQTLPCLPPAAPHHQSTWWRRALAPPPPSPWQLPQGETTTHHQFTSWVRWWAAMPPSRPPNVCCITLEQTATRSPTSSTLTPPCKGLGAWQVEVKTNLILLLYMSLCKIGQRFTYWNAIDSNINILIFWLLATSILLLQQ